MNAKMRRQLKSRKRRVDARIDKAYWSGRTPMLRAPAIKYELSDKQQANSAGGIGAIIQLIEQLDLRKTINHAIPLLKAHLPYDEADHVFNIALNLLAGGSCLDHLEMRRSDEAYFNALGAERIPDPTTAGNFCRRFGQFEVLMLMQAFNRVRLDVWRQQLDEIFDVAIIEVDGTMVETCGEKKEGLGMNYKKQWGTIRWWSRWPTPAKCCTWSTAAATVPAMNTLRSSLIWPFSCAARRASAGSSSGAIPTLR